MDTGWATLVVLTGLVILIVALAALASMGRATLLKQRRVDRVAGATTARPWRRSGLSFRGGYPGLARPVERCTLIATRTHIAVEGAEGILLHVPLERVTRISASLGPKAYRRYRTISWLLFGPLAILLAPQSTRTLAIHVETSEGSLWFEKAGATPGDEDVPHHIRPSTPDKA